MIGSGTHPASYQNGTTAKMAGALSYTSITPEGDHSNGRYNVGAGLSQICEAERDTLGE